MTDAVQAERSFAPLNPLAKRRLERGVIHSLVDLQAAINRVVAETNETPKPFSWTADPDQSSPPSNVGTKR